MPQPLVTQSTSGDCRCSCGSLFARLVSAGVEIKCRRCKRILLLPLAEFPATGRRQAASAKEMMNKAAAGTPAG